MMQQCKLLFESLKNMMEDLRSYTFMIDHRKNATAFSRKGKIGFFHTMALSLSFLNKSTQHEVNRFFNTLGGCENVSRQAVQAARAKISYTAFVELFEKTVKNGLAAEDGKLFEGFRLLALDGSTLMLENSEELRQRFGPTSPVKNDCYARMSMVFDLMNTFIIDAQIDSFSVGERELAMRQLKKLQEYQTGTYLMLMDRGYWKPELFVRIIEENNYFLVRVPRNVSKELAEKKEDSGYFDIQVDGKTYPLRYVRFVLNTGEIETLVTNLTLEEMPDDRLFDLYAMRWGVETKYGELKNLLYMENFTGKSELAVLQDFYATVLLSNLVAFAGYCSAEELEKRQSGKTLKYEYKPNKNMLISALREHMIAAVVLPSEAERCHHFDLISREIIQNAVPIRPGRSFPRKDNTYKHRSRRKKSIL